MEQVSTLEAVMEILGDERLYPAEKGPRDPSSPGFVFFDDVRVEDEDVRWGRELALDFEEWNAARRKANDALSFEEFENVLPFIHAQERLSYEAFKAEHPTFSPRMAYEEWNDARHDLPAPPEDRDSVMLHEILESRRYANWLINFHKHMPKGNDHWKKLVGPLIEHLDNKDCLAIYKALREILPYAPGVVAGTLFVNPDGSKYRTRGTSGMAAKKSYIKRHGLEEEFVTMDRVQKAGEQTSTWVIGTRKTSDTAASRYYDPNPQWKEDKRDDDPKRAYNPIGNTLIKVPASNVFGGHRLTVREFEQNLLHGGECFDDEEDRFASGVEEVETTDYRERVPDLNFGQEARHIDALSHEEAYLYGLIQMMSVSTGSKTLEQACEIILAGNQSPGMLHTHFMSCGRYSDEAVELAKTVKRDDGPTKEKKTGKVLPPKNEEPMLPYVLGVIFAAPENKEYSEQESLQAPWIAIRQHLANQEEEYNAHIRGHDGKRLRARRAMLMENARTNGEYTDSYDE